MLGGGVSVAVVCWATSVRCAAWPRTTVCHQSLRGEHVTYGGMGVGVCWGSGAPPHRHDTETLLQHETHDAMEVFEGDHQHNCETTVQPQQQQQEEDVMPWEWQDAGAEWSVADPTFLQSIRAGAEITCIDARTGELAEGDNRGYVQLWRWAPGRGFERGSRRRFKRGAVRALRYCPRGVWLAAAGAGGAHVMLLPSLSAVRWLPGAGGAAGGAAGVGALCWAHGGLLAGAGGAGGELCVWRVSTGRLVRRAPGEGGLAACCGGSLLLTAVEGALLLYNVRDLCNASEEEVSPRFREENAHDLGVLCVEEASSSDTGVNSLVATGGHDGRIRIWRVHINGPRLVPVCTLEGHMSAVTALRWLSDCSLSSASLDRGVRLWAPHGSKCLPPLARPPTALTVTNGLLIAGFNDGTLCVWSLGQYTLDSNFQMTCSILSHFGIGDLEGIDPLVDVDDANCEETEWRCYNEDEEEEGGGGGECDASGAKWWCAVRVGGRGSAVNCVKRRGALMATASSDGVVRLYACEGAGVRLLREMCAHRYPVTEVDFLQQDDQLLLVSAALDGQLILWELANGAVVRTLSAAGGCRGAGGGGIRAVRAWGHSLLAGGDDHAALLWDLREPSPEPCHIFSDGHEDAVLCVCWAGEGGVAVAGGAGGELIVFDTVARLTMARHEAVHELGVQSCDASQEADTSGVVSVVTGGGDSVGKLWQMRLTEAGTMTLRHILRGHGGMLTCCTLAEGGHRVVTGATDMHVRVWSCASGECVCVVALQAGVGGATLRRGAAAGEGVLCAGTLSGDVSVWTMRADMMEGSGQADVCGEERGGVEAAADSAPMWSTAGVVAWLRELCQKNAALADLEDSLVTAARQRDVDGQTLVGAPLNDVMAHFGFEMACTSEDVLLAEAPAEDDARAVLLEEVLWLRDWTRVFNMAHKCIEEFPHSGLCALSHVPLLDAVIGGDGFTYDRRAIAAALNASQRSPLTARPLASPLLTNRKATLAARTLLRLLCKTMSTVK